MRAAHYGSHAAHLRARAHERASTLRASMLRSYADESRASAAAGFLDVMVAVIVAVVAFVDVVVAVIVAFAVYDVPAGAPGDVNDDVDMIVDVDVGLQEQTP